MLSKSYPWVPFVVRCEQKTPGGYYEARANWFATSCNGFGKGPLHAKLNALRSVIYYHLWHFPIWRLRHR